MNRARIKPPMKMGRPSIPRALLLADLRRVAQETGSLTSTTYEAQGRYSGGTITDRFGTWPHALELAGLRRRDGYDRAVRSALVEQRIVKQGLGRPRQVRPCLKYDDPFTSDGPHNQICPRCRELNERMGATMEACG